MNPTAYNKRKRCVFENAKDRETCDIIWPRRLRHGEVKSGASIWKDDLFIAFTVRCDL